MTTWENRQVSWLCDNIVRTVAGVDSVYAQGVYKRIIDIFLRESASWIEVADFTSDSQGNVRVDFSYIGAEPMVIKRVRFDGYTVKFSADPSDRALNDTGTAPYLYSATPYPDVLALRPAPNPDLNFTVSVRATLVLNEDDSPAAPVPDWLFSRYKEHLRAGVLGELMMEPGKPYSNLTLAATHMANFKHGISLAKDQARKQFGENESEWVYPQGFML